jgi:hypothetical protein
MLTEQKNTQFDEPPVFDSWNKWYIVVVIVNIIIVSIIYFYFNSI